MANANQVKTVGPYLQRLVEDEYVQEHLRNAAVRLREAYGRAVRQRGNAAEDKKLYANLREAAGSIRCAATALARPKPKPKRGGRKLVAVALAGGGALFLSPGARRRIQDALSSDHPAQDLKAEGQARATGTVAQDDVATFAGA